MQPETMAGSSASPTCISAGMDYVAPGAAADTADRFIAVPASAVIQVAIAQVLGNQLQAVGTAGDLVRIVGEDHGPALSPAQRPISKLHLAMGG